MQAELARLSAVIPTAIVSGRSRDKIGAFLGPELAEGRLWVAGAHGFDIAGPAGAPDDASRPRTELRPAEDFRDDLRAAAASVQLSLAAVPGALVEDNRCALTGPFHRPLPQPPSTGPLPQPPSTAPFHRPLHASSSVLTLHARLCPS